LRVALLVNSIGSVLTTDDTNCLGCRVFAGTFDADRLVRQEFQTTIEVRN